MGPGQLLRAGSSLGEVTSIAFQESGEHATKIIFLPSRLTVEIVESLDGALDHAQMMSSGAARTSGLIFPSFVC